MLEAYWTLVLYAAHLKGFGAAERCVHQTATAVSRTTS